MKWIMKKQFIDIYSKLQYCSHIPDQYYWHILTLSGMVYNPETDRELENDLKQLTLAYDAIHNSTLEKIKSIVHEIVFWTKPKRNNRLPDIDHLLYQHRNATIDQINTLIVNIAQLNNQGNIENNRQVRIAADFTPLIRQLEQLMKELKPLDSYDFNLPKIIGWLTQKGLSLRYLKEVNSTEDDNWNKKTSPHQGIAESGSDVLLWQFCV